MLIIKGTSVRAFSKYCRGSSLKLTSLIFDVHAVLMPVDRVSILLTVNETKDVYRQDFCFV